jgi:hypothetical protein
MLAFEFQLGYCIQLLDIGCSLIAAVGGGQQELNGKNFSNRRKLKPRSSHIAHSALAIGQVRLVFCNTTYSTAWDSSKVLCLVCGGHWTSEIFMLHRMNSL